MPDAPFHPSLVPPRPPRPPVKRVAPIGCLYYIWAALGSILIAVTLPVLLVALRVCIHPQRSGEDAVAMLLAMVAGAAFLCSPLTIILSSVLLMMLAQSKEVRTMKQTIQAGAIRGVGMAFLNLPGYFSAAFMIRDDSFAVLRMILLFIVAGSSCGVWIGWQAWRVRNPGERFFPRFTLQTLLLFVFLWGGVMLAFQPPPEVKNPVIVPKDMM